MKIKHLLILITTGLLFSCSNFPEKYENIIEDEKIRPFGIALDPPEAAPGDTVHVTLHMYDAGKDYSVDWELALDYSITNYGQLGQGGEILDLDSMSLTNTGSNLLEFDFVVPTGNYNPLLKSSLVPEIIIEASELTSDETQALESFGINVGTKGVKTEDLIEMLDTIPQIPGEMAPFIDGIIGLTEIRAKVTSSKFKLDVTKKLTVRYSNRLTGSGFVNSVNKNPQFESMGIITVHKKDINDAAEIKTLEADTQWFSVTASDSSVPLGSVVDTFVVKDNKSYFLIADTAGIAQKYRSPDDVVHKEQLFFEWFYTNIDAPNDDWERLIEIEGDDQSLPVVALKIPKDKSMHNFNIRCVALDWRPEWALLNSAGVGYLEAAGYFKYE